MLKFVLNLTTVSSINERKIIIMFVLLGIMQVLFYGKEIKFRSVSNEVTPSVSALVTSVDEESLRRLLLAPTPTLVPMIRG
jgi:hypothetical protein